MKEDRKGEVARELEDEVQELRVEHILASLEHIGEMVAQLQAVVGRLDPKFVVGTMKKPLKGTLQPKLPGSTCEPGYIVDIIRDPPPDLALRPETEQVALVAGERLGGAEER